MIEPTPELSVAEQIDAVCDQFERDFRSGRRPSIEICVSGADEVVRTALFRALLELEIELRQNAGETLQVSEYETRFPQAVKTVRAVFEGAIRDQATVSSVTAAGLETSRGPVQKAKRSATGDQSAPLKQLGRFQIKSVLGEGAFGTVYRAHDPQLDRDVAVKVPRFAGQQSVEDRQRFLREARAAAGLHQANICPVHEVGTINGRDYIVLAFIDGKPLSKLLQTQPKLSDRQIAAVVRKLAAALQEAHDQGIIHRDLKPANIMINRKGEPVIMDFGLARRSLSDDAQISHSGQIIGTPAYMSPEQARGDGKNLDLRTDVYSLGIVLYELICGRRPFEGTVTEVIGQILHTEPPPPSQFRNTVPPELQAICLKAIARNPAERFASMKEFAAALVGYARALPTSERPATAPEVQTGKGPSTNQFADLLAAISSDVESKVERAVRRAGPPGRAPSWTYIAGSGLMGLVVLLGILFFVRKDTVTVIVNIPIDIKDPSFSFILDKNPIAADAFAAPFELKPGDHELIVNKDGKLFKHFRFHVDAGMAKDALIPEDVTPKSVSPEEILAGLQGRWIAIEQSRGGARLTADELKMENKVLTINEKRFSMEYQLPQNPAKRGVEAGAIIRIDPNATPAEIDMVFERGAAGPLQFKGIFELKGNRLIHCYRKCHEATCERPVDYTTAKGEAVFHVVYERASEPATDWIDLFNGKDLTGWKLPPDGTENPWKVENGLLSSDSPRPMSMLATERSDYRDVHIRAEALFGGGRAGIKVRTPLDQDPHVASYTVAMFDATPPPESGRITSFKPPLNTWVTLEFIIRGFQVKVIVDGKTIVEYDDNRIKLPSGRIALARGPKTKVSFRKIQVRELSGDVALSPPVENGWVKLFNGTDLTGWIPVASRDGWSVQDGVLTANPGDGWLATERDYDNYELELEYRIPPNGNSGVFLRAPLNGAASGKGLLEVQAIDDSSPNFRPIADKSRTGAIYGLFSPSQQANAPTDVWNKLAIRADGPRIVVSVNGRQVLEGSLDGTSLPTLTSEMQRPTGRIGLQRRPASKVEFRNIRIRTLSAEQIAISAGASTFQGHSYRFFPEQLSWKTAKARCETLGGHLVIIENPAENSFVATLVTAGSNDSAWIGATDEGTEGKWRWVNGQPFTWTNWFTRQGQPNDKGAGEDFALMSNKRLANGESIDWEWCDQPNESLPAHQPGYVCEWDTTATGKP